MNKGVLSNLSAGKLSVKKAYRTLYPKARHIRRVRFYKIRFRIRESKAISRFLNILLFLPVPRVIANIALSTKLREFEKNDRKTIQKLLKYGPVTIDIEAAEANIMIKSL